MEHDVYICTWRRSNDGYDLYVKSQPHIRGSAATFPEAEERLIDAIQDAGGAIQAVLEFDPPLPQSAAEEKYRQPEVYLICGDDRFETDAPRGIPFGGASEIEERLRWLDAFYEKPVCRKCKSASGKRNNHPVTLTYAPGRYDAALGTLGNDGGPSHQIVSEEFLALLTPDEKRGLEFQSTVRKGRRSFYELVGPEGPPPVAVAGMKVNGWRCPLCDHRTWGYWNQELSIHSFIAHSDLAANRRGVFAVGTFPRIELAVTACRWRELLGRKGTRGFASTPLGVAPDHEVVRCPELPTL